MTQALYRKYRPARFAEVIGQAAVKTTLQNALKTGRISHAYLFNGPRGVGKTTVARIFAKAVNCQNLADGEPDTVCQNCKLLQEGRFLDLLEIDAASYTGVDNVRELIDHVRFAPSFGRYKVFIIDEVHMLSKAAFNALLKTLEEPPAHAIFILATTEIHKVPATIISRTQRFDFKAVALTEIMQLFETVVVDQELVVAPEARRMIASAAAGSFRDALSILDQVASLAGGEVKLEDVEEILGQTRTETLQKFLGHVMAGKPGEAATLVRQLSAAGRDLVQFSRNLLEYLRLILLVKTGAALPAEIGLIPDEERLLAEQARSLPASKILSIIKAVLESHRQSKYSPVPELPLLAAVMELVPASQIEQNSPPPPSLIKEGEKRSSSLDLGMILDKWAEVMTRVKDYNHSLLSSLRLGRVVSISGAELVLAFPYNFHKETIEARKNRLVVEQALTEVFNEKLKIKACLERELPARDLPADLGAKAGSEDLVGEAIKALGK